MYGRYDVCTCRKNEQKIIMDEPKRIRITGTVLKINLLCQLQLPGTLYNLNLHLSLAHPQIFVRRGINERIGIIP